MVEGQESSQIGLQRKRKVIHRSYPDGRREGGIKMSPLKSTKTDTDVSPQETQWVIHKKVV